MTTMSATEPTTEALPDPLVPKHVDLRELPYMPLAVGRLRDSDLTIHSTGDEFRAAVLLWCASWQQEPAASLPNNEQSLATFAGYARAPKEWKKIREGAMRGFVLCSDDRFYHRVIAGYALKAWEERQEYLSGKEHDNDRKKREREWRGVAFQALREINVVPDWNIKTSLLRQLVREHNLVVGVSGGEHVTGHVTDEVTPPVTVTCGVTVTANKRREEKGREDKDLDQEKSSLRSDSSSAAPTTTDAGKGKQSKKRKDQEPPSENLRQHTRNAIAAFNDILGKPNGLLPRVSETVGFDTHCIEVRRCLRTASEINLEVHGDPAVTPEFWREYFGIVSDDPFKSGQQRGGKGHENWTPDFEYLTRKDVMLKVFEKAASEGDE